MAFFRIFGKSKIRQFCIANFSMKTQPTEKNGVYHDDCDEKCKKTAISDFLFLKFCHRDFLPQSYVKIRILSKSWYNLTRKKQKFALFFLTIS